MGFVHYVIDTNQHLKSIAEDVGRVEDALENVDQKENQTQHGVEILEQLAFAKMDFLVEAFEHILDACVRQLLGQVYLLA